MGEGREQLRLRFIRARVMLCMTPCVMLMQVLSDLSLDYVDALLVRHPPPPPPVLRVTSTRPPLPPSRCRCTGLQFIQGALLWDRAGKRVSSSASLLHLSSPNVQRPLVQHQRPLLRRHAVQAEHLEGNVVTAPRCSTRNNQTSLPHTG